MINNDRFIETMLVTDGLPIKILDILKEMNFLNSEFALMNMIKNYKLCFKDKTDVSLGVMIDLCMIDRHKKELNACLEYMGGYEMFNTFGTPCYDWGMICKFSQVQGLKSHIQDILSIVKNVYNYMIYYLEDRTDSFRGYTVVKEVSNFLSTPITMDRKSKFKINDNYSLMEYDNGILLVNTEYGYDQWVKVGFPIGNVYISLYNMVLTEFGDKNSIIIRREYYNKIYENLGNCYRSDSKIIENKYTGYFVNGERFLKLKFGDVS